MEKEILVSPPQVVEFKAQRNEAVHQLSFRIRRSLKPQFNLDWHRIESETNELLQKAEEAYQQHMLAIKALRKLERELGAEGTVENRVRIFQTNADRALKSGLEASRKLVEDFVVKYTKK